MTSWKDDARRDSLRQFASAQPPQVADSDLIVMAINRLERAVVKMQARQYDELMHEHLQRASEMLGWVAKNVWLRDGEAPAPEVPPMGHGELHEELRGLMDSIDDSLTADAAAEAFRNLADQVAERGLAPSGDDS